MNKNGTYNGFANYETWAVSLWMANDRQAYEYFRSLALASIACRDDRLLSPLPKAARYATALADALCREFEERSPVRDQVTVYADLMNAALSEVDWYELAEHLLNDISED